ncbi:MAG: hypothetical protein IJ262_04530 [Clostridia bacterium]|nr:hypothetical protein [Clostridia bacterium]
MKKIISLLLVTVMLFTVMAPMASAADEKLPIIYIRGNGEPIYDGDGNKLALGISDSLSNVTNGNFDMETVVETCANIMLPLLTEGLIFDEWDNYGRAVYEELKPLFTGAELDENGNPINGSGIAQSRIDASEAEAKRDTVNYGLYDYNFMYDWRLSPYDHVDRLHQYVLTVLHTTQKDQVCIYATCLGGGLLMAYLEKYGDQGLVKNVILNEVLSNGATIISKSFSGKIEFDANQIERYFAQMEYCSEIGMPGGFFVSDLVNQIVFKTMDLFNQISVTDKLLDGVEDLYGKLYEALMPAVCHATGFATMVNYWTCVSEEDFDAALNLLYGEEDSELRTKYAGLIKKIVYYRDHCTAKLDELYDKFENEYNIYIGFVARYGYMNPPITEDADKLSDFLVSLDAATMGATCAKIGTTFSDEYILQRTAEGKDAYISPDHQVDLSTALYPDRTWVVKNAHHSFPDVSDHIILSFLQGTNYTIHSEGAYPQFSVFYEKEGKIEPMTEENCADYEWISLPEENPTTETRLVALMRFLTMIINLFKNLLNGDLDFSNLLG